VANIEVGRLSVERRREPLGPILERSVALFRRESTERGIALELVAEDGLPDVSGDAERVVQVLSNLVSNALRYTERGGRVVVSAERQVEFVEVAVTDNGAGIPTSNLALIFERYWTVRGTAPKGGTGLGLAIARGIVEAHGGRLWAESAVGKGSTFRFTLRVAG